MLCSWDPLDIDFLLLHEFLHPKVFDGEVLHPAYSNSGQSTSGSTGITPTHQLDLETEVLQKMPNAQALTDATNLCAQFGLAAGEGDRLLQLA